MRGREDDRLLVFLAAAALALAGLVGYFVVRRAFPRADAPAVPAPPPPALRYPPAGDFAPSSLPRITPVKTKEGAGPQKRKPTPPSPGENL